MPADGSFKDKDVGFKDWDVLWQKVSPAFIKPGFEPGYADFVDVNPQVRACDAPLMVKTVDARSPLRI